MNTSKEWSTSFGHHKTWVSVLDMVVKLKDCQDCLSFLEVNYKKTLIILYTGYKQQSNCLSE